MLSELKKNRRVVGIKQSKKALLDGGAEAVYLAEDAEERVRLPLIELAAEKGVEVIPVSTMLELGAACGIDVGAAVVVQLKA